MGWLECGIPPKQAEDVAQHSFETTSITLLLAKRIQEEGMKINCDKAVKMAVIHDWGEAIIGDISEGISKRLGPIKDDMERESFKELTKNLSDKKEYLDLWNEYLEEKSIEAKIVRAADLLSILIELTHHFEEGRRNEDLVELWQNVKNQLLEKADEFPPIKELLSELEKQYPT